MTETDTTSPNPGPAFRHGFTRNWPGYFAAVRGKGPRETTSIALDAFAREGLPDADAVASGAPRPVAVDLGCGEGRDAAAMLERGWRVVAIDGHESAFEHMARRDALLDHPALETRLEPFETCTIPMCFFLNSSFSLPFCHPDAFDALWKVIRAAIEPGGRFAGQFFGERDTWANIPDRTHHTRLQVEKLLLGLDIEHFEEDEKDSQDAEGQDKHWHVFHVVARRPA
jgi:SAM-dependent methyltransferase